MIVASVHDDTEGSFHFYVDRSASQIYTRQPFLFEISGVFWRNFAHLQVDSFGMLLTSVATVFHMGFTRN